MLSLVLWENRQMITSPRVFHFLSNISGCLFSKLRNLREVLIILQHKIRQGLDVTWFAIYKGNQIGWMSKKKKTNFWADDSVRKWWANWESAYLRIAFGLPRCFVWNCAGARHKLEELHEQSLSWKPHAKSIQRQGLERITINGDGWWGSIR